METLQINIKNFKSISSTDISLKTGLNILIGPNGSGKTCVLSSLKFIRDLIQHGSAQAMARGGGAKSVYRRGENVISFKMVLDYDERTFKLKKWPCQFSWEIELSQTGAERIATIVTEEIKITANVEGNDKLLFQINVDRPERGNPKTKSYFCDSKEFGRDLFSWWNEYHRKDSKKKLNDKFLSNIRDLLKHARAYPDRTIFSGMPRFDSKIRALYSLFYYLNEYSISPDIARQSTEQLPIAIMRPDGAGVSEVIHALQNKLYQRIEFPRYYETMEYLDYSPYSMPYMTRNLSFQYYRYFGRASRIRKKKSTIDNALNDINRELSAAVKPIERAGIQIDPTNGRRFVVFHSRGETFNPEEVSDGTIKWLCILVSILVPYSTVYLLEEPENYMHPWMQQKLISMMRERALENDTIFILTTHSSTILNSAEPKEVIVVRTSQKGTSLSMLENMSEIEEVLTESQFRLGDLWVSGALGGIPADE